MLRDALKPIRANDKDPAKVKTAYDESERVVVEAKCDAPLQHRDLCEW